MNKQFLSLLLAALMLFSALPLGVAAEEAPLVPARPEAVPVAEVEEPKAPELEVLPVEAEPKELSTPGFSYTLQGGAAYITQVKGSFSGDTLTIPAEIDGYPVKGLSNFYNHQIVHLILPDSVEVIAGEMNTSRLKTLTVGAGLKSISQDVISRWAALDRVEVSVNNPYMKSIDGVVYDAAGETMLFFPPAFDYENPLSTYTVPASAKNIDVLFRFMMDTYRQIEIVYPENSPHFVKEGAVVYNGDKTRIFSCDKTIAGGYVMPDTVKSIEAMAFAGCKDLTSVKVAPGVTEIVYATFDSCTSLKQVSLPQGLITIGDYAFEHNRALESIVLPDSVTTIGHASFYSCYSLTTVNMPASLVTIGGNAFQYNEKQTAEVLAMPASVTEIGWSAFAYTGYLALDLSACSAKVGGGAFADCKSLVSVKLGNNNVFGNSIFQSCTALKNVDLGTTLPAVTHHMFASCTALEEIILPESVKIIDWNAFQNCTRLAKVIAKGTLEEIGSSAFYNTGLTDLAFLENSKVTYIDWYTFVNTKATSVTFPETVTEIGYKSFMDSSNLATVDIPAGVTSMCGKSMLGTAWYESQPDGAVYLEHVAMEYKGSSIPNDNVVIPDGIRVIADYAFAGKRTVSSVTLGKDVQYVSPYAFYYSSIKSFYVHPDNPYYSSHNGILYNKAGTEKICVPIDTVELENISYQETYKAGQKIRVNDFELKLTYRDNTTEYYAPYRICDDKECYEFVPKDMVNPGESTFSLMFAGAEFQLPITIETVKGDVDGVYGINLDDAIHLLYFMNFSDKYSVNQSVDFNGDGKTDLDDAIYLLYHVNFPAKYPLH